MSLKGPTQLLLPPTLNMAFRFFEPRIVDPFPNEKLLRKEKIIATIVKEGKDYGYRANNFSLGNGSAIRGSKNLNAMFNVADKSN